MQGEPKGFLQISLIEAFGRRKLDGLRIMIQMEF